jgi:hypothetical protein
MIVEKAIPDFIKAALAAECIINISLLHFIPMGF